MNKIELKEIFKEKNIDFKYLGKQLVQKKICGTSDIGVHGNLFGGYLLSWIDESAAAFVTEMIEFKPIVTLKISEVLFKEPVKVNDIVNLDATVLSIGNTSVKLLIEVINVKTNKMVCHCETIFVHVDPITMKPKKI